MEGVSNLTLFLFFGLFPLVGLWFLMVRNFARQMAKRQPLKYKTMQLDKLFPGSLSDWTYAGGGTFHFDNSQPVMAMLKFILGRQDIGLRDRKISAITVFMRRLFYLYLAMFGAAIISFGYDAATWEAPRSGASSYRPDGYALYNEGRYEDAIAEFDSVLLDDFNNAEILYWRAMSNWHLDRREAALSDFSQVTYIDRSHYKAHLHIDELLAPERRFAEIVSSWDRFLRYNPNHPEALFERAGTHYHMGKTEKSARDLERACRYGHQEACVMAKRFR